jgi:ribosome maturation factor RimP
MMISKKTVEEIIEEILAGTDKFLMEVVVQPTNRIFVYLDSDTSITIHDCQEISRIIESRLDRDNENYDLTVSSYGIDSPLKLLRQYRKNIGKEINLFTNEGKTINGVLVKIDENSLELEHPVKNQKKEIKRENTHLPLSEIKTAKLIVRFEK